MAETKQSVPQAQAPKPPNPGAELLVTQLLIVSDQQQSRRFYEEVIGAKLVRPADPVVLQLSNTWLILNSGGGPTEDKPDVIAEPPKKGGPLTAALNFRVPDIKATYDLWKSRGAKFFTEPKRLGPELRCYLADPDGHYIEVGQIVAETD